MFWEFFFNQNSIDRFFHFGFDKSDQVDEIGNPIIDDGDNSMLSNDDHLRHDLDCGIENISIMINDPEPPPPRQTVTTEPVEEPKVLKDHQNEEGTTKERVTKDIFPQIKNESSIVMKRSDSALNIFDQTTILKLFSAKNWTETFFNRIFRKKFLVISPGDESLLSTLKHDGPFALEQQLMHLSQKYPRDFLLPAIASSESDKKLTHGLCCSLKSLPCMFITQRDAS